MKDELKVNKIDDLINEINNLNFQLNHCTNVYNLQYYNSLIKDKQIELNFLKKGLII
jgi:hypothetical protein